MDMFNSILSEGYSDFVIYHGTALDFKDFDLGKVGTFLSSDFGKGIYFTRDKDSADRYRKLAVQGMDEEHQKAWKEYREFEERWMRDKSQRSFEDYQQAYRRYMEIGEKVDRKGGGRLIKAKIKPTARVYRHDAEGRDPYLGDRLRREGYDVVWIDPNGLMEEFLVLNLDAIRVLGDIRY